MNLIPLLYQTPPEWAATACHDFNHFLLDHASCERKASAVGLSFVVRYPDRTKIIEPMIQFAREELEHFHQVTRLCLERGLNLIPDEPDEYVNRIMKAVRFGREERFLDRLLTSALIEARGAERLGLVAQHLSEEKLKHFYARLARAEGAHHHFFLEMASHYFPEDTIDNRLHELIAIENEAIRSVPFRSALH